jgi:HAD superfamily phosphoserine phosphatase-like hydrolase
VGRFDLVAFDVDGTLVVHDHGQTVWEVLNRRFTGDDGWNPQRYQEYLDGKLSYADWVAQDIEGWKAGGATRDKLIEAFAPLHLVEGTREALTALRGAGMRTVVISGTLDLMLHTLLPDPPLDEIYCNHIAFDGEGRIAHWQATPFDMEGKATCLRAVALREGIPLARCALVGDSSNDVWIARTAGFAVALNPNSQELEGACQAVVRSRDLRDVLPFLLGTGTNKN